MRTKDLLMCVGLERGPFKALQQSDSLPFHSLPIAEGEGDTDPVNINDRYWSDYLAWDAVALKMMMAIYEDNRLKEGGAKRPPIVTREAAQYLAGGFAWSLRQGFEDAVKNGAPVWCAWAVSEEYQEGLRYHAVEFLRGSASEVVADLEKLTNPPVRVIWLNATLIARQVYDWLVEHEMPEASELAPFFKTAS